MINYSLGKDLLIEALKYHLLKADQKRIYQTSRTRPRLPIGLPKVIRFRFNLK
jgi:kelch-like protein 2/3